MLGFVLGVAVTAAVWVYEARTGFFAGKLKALRRSFDNMLG
ncbi:hypothetical protein [Geminicoccus flavidas]|nr:hypothetical protein [Geminicoccus flavidas]